MTNTIRTLLLIGTHAAAVGLGFGIGIYALPILTAPDSPSVEQVRAYLISATEFTDYFTEMLAAREASPEEDLVSGVANARVDGELLSLPERLSML